MSKINREQFEAWGMSDTDLRITLECETYAGIAWLAWQAATNEAETKLTALTTQLESVVAENAARKSEVPLGAIENGRAFADRLAAYPFECQGGNLSMCSDWQELICCFEHLAEWAMHGQDETPATSAFLAEVRASGIDQWIASRDGRWNGTTKEAERFSAKIRQEAK